MEDAEGWLLVVRWAKRQRGGRDTGDDGTRQEVQGLAQVLSDQFGSGCSLSNVNR